MRILTKKFLVLTIILILIITALIYWLMNEQPFRYAGTLEVTKIDIAARLSAAITQVAHEEGDHITQGEPLIKFDCEDYKTAAALAHLSYIRYRNLLKAQGASQQKVDNLATLAKEADIRISWCTLTSPITGTVLDRYHEPGEWMNAGTKILTLANIHDIWAYIYVPQPLIAKLALGMKLKAFLPELNDREFDGTIIKISDEAEFTPKNVQTQSERARLIYGVKVSFKHVNTAEILKPGMTVEIELPEQIRND